MCRRATEVETPGSLVMNGGLCSALPGVFLDDGCHEDRGQSIPRILKCENVRAGNLSEGAVVKSYVDCCQSSVEVDRTL